MDVKEKLTELINDVLSYLPWGEISSHTASECADHLIANGVTVADGKDTEAPAGWIPVTERLPEGDKVVLCYKADRGIRFGKLLDATYANGVQAFMDRDRTFAFGGTHWMPLPEPPKGE